MIPDPYHYGGLWLHILIEKDRLSGSGFTTYKNSDGVVIRVNSG
jgi:hypothetical protein